MSTSTLKHVQRRHFFVRECVENGELVVLPVDTSRNVADVLTKVLCVARFRELAAALYGGFGAVLGAMGAVWDRRRDGDG